MAVEELGSLSAEALRIADDYHPDRPEEAPFALSEMRDAVWALAERIGTLQERAQQAERERDSLREREAALVAACEAAAAYIEAEGCGGVTAEVRQQVLGSLNTALQGEAIRDLQNLLPPTQGEPQAQQQTVKG